MKTMGLIGGMSWESSLEYYKIINRGVHERLGKLHSASCIMYSFDFQEIEELQHQEDWEMLSEKMVGAARSLKNAGADFVVICTNTMHKLADDIVHEVQLPLLHITDVVAREIKNKNLTKVGLLGTKFTMNEDFYKKRLREKHNIEVVIPEEPEKDLVHNVIYDELCQGIVQESSRQKFISIINNLCAKGAEGIILGCTEIPKLIKEEHVDTHIFDSTEIHAISAVEFALGELNNFNI